MHRTRTRVTLQRATFPTRLEGTVTPQVTYTCLLGTTTPLTTLTTPRGRPSAPDLPLPGRYTPGTLLADTRA